MIPGSQLSQVHFQGSLFVLQDQQGLGIGSLALDHLAPQLEIMPLLFTTILPTVSTSQATVFHEEIGRISLHVGHAPGQSIGSSHGKQWATWQRCTHHIMISPAQGGFIPDCRQAIDFKVRI